jgi:hypothetical protein
MYHLRKPKTPQFREVSEDEIKGYRELLQRIGEITSDFMGDLAERWRAGKGNEVRMLFREEKLFNRELGRSHLNIHAAMCLHSWGGDWRTSAELLRLARQMRADTVVGQEKWLETAVDVKHKRIREVIGAGDAGWVAVPISPLPLKPEEDRPFVRGAESNDPRSRETIKFEKA